MNISIHEKLIEALRKIGGRFEDGELAYLALTSKIELPIRDRLAFMLKRDLDKEGYVVAREWPSGNRNRVDIAILKNGAPVALIELKALYAFDIVRDKIKKYINEVKKDEDSSLVVMENAKGVYMILLATLPEKDGGSEMKKVIKYQGGIKGGVEKYHGDIGALTVSAKHIVKKRFSGRKLVSDGTISGGSSFGVKTDVLYWLFQAGK
jgi:hypothetical protein